LTAGSLLLLFVIYNAHNSVHALARSIRLVNDTNCARKVESTLLATEGETCVHSNNRLIIIGPQTLYRTSSSSSSSSSGKSQYFWPQKSKLPIGGEVVFSICALFNIDIIWRVYKSRKAENESFGRR
jgi:hypothetical protein